MMELVSQPYSKHEASVMVAAKSINLKRLEARDRRWAAGIISSPATVGSVSVKAVAA